ncbi:hypothetical protein [Pelagicoccus mobilis]|uniref:Uncharacterized protein n=1 Tax=Pelagicoccus mobilis TaxID=415221 RepID=A0A934RZW3_9BACT|nr:hypothetical protein [Pelagicoccus mobilis]MBK1880705.1 hypothetical protein [Pelagicoccus mobilis]
MMKKFKVSYGGSAADPITIEANSAEEAAMTHFVSSPKDKTIFVEHGLFKEETFNPRSLEKKYPELKELTEDYGYEDTEEIEYDPDEERQSAIDEIKYFFFYTNFGKRLAGTIILTIGYFIYHAYKN